MHQTSSQPPVNHRVVILDITFLNAWSMNALTGLYTASMPARKIICARPIATTKFLWIEVRSEARVLKGGKQWP